MKNKYWLIGLAVGAVLGVIAYGIKKAKCTSVPKNGSERREVND